MPEPCSAHTLMEIDPRFPTVSKQQRETLLEVKAALEAQAPKGAAPDPFEQEQRVANGEGHDRSDGQPAIAADGLNERSGGAGGGAEAVAMATRADPQTGPTRGAGGWYSVSAEEVTARLGVDPAVGLSSQQAAELLDRHGPNALPVEQPVPGWRRFVGQYRSYMQMILLGAAIVSLAIKEWSTGVLLILITVVNAVVGLRQEGKAESAMNALKAMVKATARVRRDGSEAEIAAEEVVVGDVVLLAAGDEVPADGRIIEASSLQIDESALTGESVPASKGVETPAGTDLAPGEQTDMAFMHTPVTHGSGVMIVTATGSDTQVGKIAGMLASTAREQTPLTRQLNTLTLWIAAAAGITMIVMFVLGAQRDQSSTVVFTSAVALAIAAIPEAMPTVLAGDPVARRRGPGRARRGAQGPGLGRDARFDLGDQLGQDRDADDEPDDRDRGGRPDRPLHDLRLGL